MDAITHRILSEISQWEQHKISRLSPTSIQYQPPPPVTPKRNFPESIKHEYKEFEIIHSPSALILGDSEIPYHDHTMFELATEVATHHAIDTLIIAGDFVALDSFSSWPKFTSESPRFQEELEPAYESLKLFMTIFKTIVYVSGNHERRIAKQTDGNIIFGYFLNGLDSIRFSEYAYCVLISNDQKFLVAHPDRTHSVPTTAPRKLENVFALHILCGHTHRQSLSFSDDGLHYCIEIGHCRDVSRTAYKTLRASTFPEWNQGFVIVINGVPFLINRHNADFFKK